MDQLAILYGESDTLLKIAFTGMHQAGFEIERVVVHSRFSEYDVVVLNSNVAHALASSEYNVRRAECDELVGVLNHKFGKEWANVSQIGEAGVLGTDLDVFAPFSNLAEYVKRVARTIGGNEPRATTLAQRAMHVISENLRVDAAVGAIRGGDLVGLHVLLNNAHESLAHLYQVSCPEIEALRSDVLEFSRSIAGVSDDRPFVIGPRMCGGGFGGSLISLVHKNVTDKFLEHFDGSDRYKHSYGFVPACFVVQISQGLTVQ
jgi:galactokinase